MKAIHKKLILIMIILAGFTAFSACSGKGQPSLEELGFTVVITYDFAGGKTGEYYHKNVYYKPGTPIIEPAEGNALGLPAKEDEYISAWVYAVTDADGKPVLDADGKPVPSETKVDFSTFVAEKNTTIMVAWSPVNNITVILGDGEDDKKTFFFETGSVNLNDLTEGVTKPAYTLVDFWYDAACETSPVVFPIVMPPVGEEALSLTVYPRYIEGRWTVLRTRQDVLRIGNAAGADYFLANDIDMTDEEGQPSLWANINSFTGVFDGDGHTISNFQTVKGETDRRDRYGLFNTIDGDAAVRNVTFKNASVTVYGSFSGGPIRAGFLAGVVTGSVENCILENCTLSLRPYTDKIMFVYNEENPAVKGIYGGGTPAKWENVAGTVPVDLSIAEI